MEQKYIDKIKQQMDEQVVTLMYFDGNYYVFSTETQILIEVNMAGASLFNFIKCGDNIQINQSSKKFIEKLGGLL